MNIFRKEAIESHSLDWMGRHSLTLAKPPLSALVVSLATIGVIVGLMIFCSYEINVEASGLVSFRPSIYTLTSPLEGVVTFAKNVGGEQVSQGETLYTIARKIILGGVEKHLKKELLIREKIASLEAIKTDIAMSIARVKNDYVQKKEFKKKTRFYYQRLLTTQGMKFELAEKRNSLFLEHSKHGVISKIELQEAARQLLDVKEETQRIKVSISQINYEIKMLYISLNQELEAFKTKEAEYDRWLADAHQELLEVASSASADIIAPSQGILGYSSVIPGDTVKEGDVIALILPDGALPTITLNIPSAAMGGIHAGQTVKIRVSSFPWRRYGKLNGIVKTVSPAAIRKPEGMFFTVTAEPEHNPNFRLRQGMEVTANITTDKKRVYQLLYNFIAAKWKN